ncbi:hypothetical protein TNCV_5137031 [Trichonephila clavipes]|nr:hypothetical protein TNCV_5137031 [Trichonephila clavipes]
MSKHLCIELGIQDAPRSLGQTLRRDRWHHTRIQICIATLGRKCLRSALGVVAYKSIRGNKTELPLSCTLSSTSEECGKCTGAGRYARDFRIGGRKYTNSRKVVSRKVPTEGAPDRWIFTNLHKMCVNMDHYEVRGIMRVRHASYEPRHPTNFVPWTKICWISVRRNPSIMLGVRVTSGPPSLCVLPPQGFEHHWCSQSCVGPVLGGGILRKHLMSCNYFLTRAGAPVAWVLRTIDTAVAAPLIRTYDLKEETPPTSSRFRHSATAALHVVEVS